MQYENLVTIEKPHSKWGHKRLIANSSLNILLSATNNKSLQQNKALKQNKVP